MGSVAPHPVLGYIWVTLGRVNTSIGQKGSVQRTARILSKTETYMKMVKSEACLRTLLDELIT